MASGLPADLQPGMLGEGSPKAALRSILAGACCKAVGMLSSAGEVDLMCYQNNLITSPLLQ